MSQLFVLLSKAASQLLFYVLAKLSTQVLQVYERVTTNPRVRGSNPAKIHHLELENNTTLRLM